VIFYFDFDFLPQFCDTEKKWWVFFPKKSAQIKNKLHYYQVQKFQNFAIFWVKRMTQKFVPYKKKKTLVPQAFKTTPLLTQT